MTRQTERWSLPVWETEKETGELGTTTGRGGDEDRTSDGLCCLRPLGGDENALWLTTNEGPECAPLDDMEFRISARVRLDLPVIQQGLCQHQQRQKPDGTAGARCLAQLDQQGQHAQKCLIGGDRAKLHDVGCHIIHNDCCEAGLKSQRGVVVPALVHNKCIEKKMEQFISGESKKIFRISSHTLLIGLTVSGKYAWQEEEEIREDSSTVLMLQEQVFLSELVRDIQDAISLILLSRTMW